jgi:hypothetical protein
MKRPNFLIVLDALYLGIPVKCPAGKKGFPMEIGTDDTGTEVPCWQITNRNLREKTEETLLFQVDTSLHDFIKYCEKYSDDEITILAHNIALNQIKKMESKDRQSAYTQVY